VSDLISRLEAATEGSRELDAEIWRVAGGPGVKRWVPDDPNDEWYNQRDIGEWVEVALPYTRSIDAALTTCDPADAVGILHAVTWQRQIGDIEVKDIPRLIVIAALKAQEGGRDK